MSEEEFDSEVSKTKKAIRIFRFFGWLFVALGFVVFIIGLYYWILKKDDFNEVGDFVGGVSGSLWALAGLFFIYIAFLGQKIEIKYQQEELKLNREELRESKEVFKVQANIMLDQKLDTTFFNLLDNHRKLIDSFKDRKRNHTENITGYDALENIYNSLTPYLIKYSSFLSSRNIFDSEITNSNPIKEIKRYRDVEILYNEVLGIITFISKKIREENKAFYLNILFNNLSNQEKFLLTAYNINCSTSFLEELNFKNYLKYNFIDFCIEELFVREAALYIRNVTTGLENDFIVKFDNIYNYSQLDLYFINKEEKIVDLINTFVDLSKKIYLLNDLNKILDNKFVNFKQITNANKELEFMLLIKGTHINPHFRIFNFLNVKVKHMIESSIKFQFSSNNFSGDIIDSWIQDHFNNTENQES